MPPIPAKKQSRPTQEVQQKTEECQGIHVDPAYYAQLSNRHLNAKDWSGCSALAVLLYWWLCDKVTEAYDENGASIGVVMFGRPVDFSTIADDKNLGTTWRAVQRNMKHLDDRGFIRRKRHQTTQGYSYEVVGCAREVLPEGAVKGKDGKTYCKKPKAEATKSSKTDEPEPSLASSFNLIGNDPELDLDYVAHVNSVVVKDDFIKVTCPKCQLTGVMTQKAHDRHLAICTGRGHDTEPVKETPTAPVKPADCLGCNKPVNKCECFKCPECQWRHDNQASLNECMAKHKAKAKEEREWQIELAEMAAKAEKKEADEKAKKDAYDRKLQDLLYGRQADGHVRLGGKPHRRPRQQTRLVPVIRKGKYQ